MKYSVHFLAAFLFLGVSLSAAEFPVTSKAVVVLADLDEARKALGTEDEFIRSLSDFDRAARVKSEQLVSPEEFLEFITGQAMAWSDRDAGRIEKAVSGAREKLSKFNLNLPERVLLVQTSGREEANTAYCRSTNVVVISRAFVNGPARELESLLIHELFHLLTRNNPGLRTKLYALIGFKPCNAISYPVELDSRRITNPDAPELDYFIEVTYQEQKVPVVPALFATPERWNNEKGGEFFHYLTWRLMVVEQMNGNWRVVRSNDKPVLLGLRDVTGFYEQVGEQPGPVLQAEEILAEYFVKVVDGGNAPARIRDEMMRLLAK